MVVWCAVIPCISSVVYDSTSTAYVWWVGNLWNSGNGKNIKDFHFEGIALVRFTVYCWIPATMEESRLYPLGFLDWLLKLPLAKRNVHKILFFPAPPRPSPCQELSADTTGFLSHFASAVTAQSVCRTTPEILAYSPWHQAKTQLTAKNLILENVDFLGPLEGQKENLSSLGTSSYLAVLSITFLTNLNSQDQFPKQLWG